MRILKLFKYNQAVKRFNRALAIAKEELVLFGFVAAIVLYRSAVGIYYFEKAAQPEQFKSVFHSLWWAITTLTTVGYGDMYPATAGGKIFTCAVLLIGLGIIAVPTGLHLLPHFPRPGRKKYEVMCAGIGIERNNAYSLRKNTGH